MQNVPTARIIPRNGNYTYGELRGSPAGTIVFKGINLRFQAIKSRKMYSHNRGECTYRRYTRKINFGTNPRKSHHFHLWQFSATNLKFKYLTICIASLTNLSGRKRNNISKLIRRNKLISLTTRILDNELVEVFFFEF